MLGDLCGRVIRVGSIVSLTVGLLSLLQAGKHEAIVKNVHDLLAKLAWDFSPEQLDHLFDCFKVSWHRITDRMTE